MANVVIGDRHLAIEVTVSVEGGGVLERADGGGSFRIEDKGPVEGVVLIGIIYGGRACK